MMELTTKSLLLICAKMFNSLLTSVKEPLKKIVTNQLVLAISITFLKLINYSCSSYPTRASYSGQVDEFRNPMKTELKTRLSSTAVFSTRFSLDF